ncbi:unnamed protein product [Arabis nemorensis]|uniref:E3 ubiquitin-protein ligase RMA n=1 Tax=Arabis nemorensis TaxID=586526 RepID=A0A565B0X7_9BRAS|nr:unnamed protein product [Arabis nemorensis]
MSSAISNGNEEDVSNNVFGCNICLELPKEPIVTLCGHLFCWPCLYKWIHFHSQSNHCPVCKSLVKEDSLVPLYGMGKPCSDPRTRKPVHGVTVPNRPSATRVETVAPCPSPRHGQRQHRSSFYGGYSGFASIPSGSRFGNILL